MTVATHPEIRLMQVMELGICFLIVISINEL